MFIFFPSFGPSRMEADGKQIGSQSTAVLSLDVAFSISAFPKQEDREAAEEPAELSKHKRDTRLLLLLQGINLASHSQGEGSVKPRRHRWQTPLRSGKKTALDNGSDPHCGI